MSNPIETHTDGTLWQACSPEIKERYTNERGRVHIYHPNAKNDYDSPDGSDEHYTCPDCGASWWVEYDG